MYKCLNCGKVLKPEQIKEKIRCHYCGYRVVIKERPKVITKVLAR